MQIFGGGESLWGLIKRLDVALSFIVNHITAYVHFLTSNVLEDPNSLIDAHLLIIGSPGIISIPFKFTLSLWLACNLVGGLRLGETNILPIKFSKPDYVDQGCNPFVPKVGSHPTHTQLIVYLLGLFVVRGVHWSFHAHLTIRTTWGPMWGWNWGDLFIWLGPTCIQHMKPIWSS